MKIEYLVYFIISLFVIGYFFVAFGTLTNQIQVTNNELITSGLAYSQARHDAMDLQFKFWWSLPIFTIILCVAWGVKNALDKDGDEIV